MQGERLFVTPLLFLNTNTIFYENAIHLPFLLVCVQY